MDIDRLVNMKPVNFSIISLETQGKLHLQNCPLKKKSNIAAVADTSKYALKYATDIGVKKHMYATRICSAC